MATERINEVPKAPPMMPWTDGTPYQGVRASNPADNSVQARFSGDPQGMFGDQSAWDGASFITLRMAAAIDGVMPYSYFPGRRDRQLRVFARTEGILAGGMYSILSRYRSLDYDVEGDSDFKKKYARRLLEGAEDGRGLADLVEGFVYDLETQDNGAFLELIGAGDPTTAMIGPVQSVAHLDSGQCMRTFDPEFPVVYIHPLTGMHHKLHRTRVYHTSRMRQPAELARGMGYCAVSRALRDVQYIRNVKMFKDEKVSGRFTRAIGYGSGFTAKQLKEVIQTTGEESKAKGFAVYKDIPFILPPGGGISDVKLGLLDLASLGDGFNYTDELTTYVYILALCFGTDARDFWPAVQSGATKADASVQNMKSRGKGQGDTIQTIEYIFSNYILPSGTTLKYDFKDDEEDLTSAQISQIRGATLVNIKNAGGITARELRAQAVAQGVLLDTALFPEDEKQIIANGEMPTIAPPASPGAAPIPGANPNPPPNNGPTGDGGGSRTPDKAEPGQTIPFKDNKAVKSMLHDNTKEYGAKISALVGDYINQTADGKVSRSNADNKLSKLKDDYAALMQSELDKAFAIGSSGADPTPGGKLELDAIRSTSANYFSGMVQDLHDVSLSMVGEDISPADIKTGLSSFLSRSASYAGTYWQSIWTGVGDILRMPSEDGLTRKVKRFLDADSEVVHCTTCPSKENTYDSFESMRAKVGIPGDGTDECLSECRCYLEVETAPGSGVYTNVLDKSWGV